MPRPACPIWFDWNRERLDCDWSAKRIPCPTLTLFELSVRKKTHTIRFEMNRIQFLIRLICNFSTSNVGPLTLSTQAAHTISLTPRSPLRPHFLYSPFHSAKYNTEISKSIAFVLKYCTAANEKTINANCFEHYLWIITATPNPLVLRSDWIKCFFL